MKSGYSGIAWIVALVECSGSGDHGPSHARHLVGHCHGDLVEMRSLAKLVEPRAQSVSSSIQVHDARSCAMVLAPMQ